MESAAADGNAFSALYYGDISDCVFYVLDAAQHRRDLKLLCAFPGNLLGDLDSGIQPYETGNRPDE